MEEQIKWVDKLKRCVEVNHSGILNWLLNKRKNHHFYQDKRKKTAITKFQFDPKELQWANDYVVTPFVNQDGDNYFEVLIDVRAAGTINQFNRTTGVKFVDEPINFDFTIRAYIQSDGNLSDGNIHLLNAEQKALVNYQKQYENELKHTGVSTITESTYQGMEAFNFFTRIWKNVDNMDETMVNSTSLHYFHELIEVHRNIMYGVSCANVWGRYITHHTDSSYQFEGRQVYPLNLSFYDTRHIFYLEASIEEIYTFYERIAHLLYIFLRPVIFEHQALSFNKLFETQTQKVLEEKFLGLNENEHYQWFVNRMKAEHNTLSGYRHPLIHYKSSNTFLKGSYGASKARIWLKNAMNGAAELIELEKKMQKILLFVNQEMHICHEAFEHMVLLCESLEPVVVEIAREPGEQKAGCPKDQ